MTHRHPHLRSSAAARALAAFAIAAAPCIAMAHGDEPHGDEPHAASAAAGASGAAPRFETATELFELVGRLRDDALVLHVHRFASNEPVAQARLEVESGDRKAVAAYDAADGSYRVADAGFVAPLREPGTHPLLITLTAGQDADLMEASLEVAGAHAPDEAHRPGWALAGALLLVGAALLGGGALLLRRRAPAGDPA